VLSSLDGSLGAYLAAHPPATPPPAPEDSRPYPPFPAGERVPEVYNIADVPHHYQVTSWYCGCAAVQMLLDHFGEEVGQVDISDVENDVEGMGTYATDNRRAGHFSGMSTAIQNPELQGYRERSLGYSSCDEYLTSDPVEDLKATIRGDLPVEILTYYDESLGSGHYRVVKGYDDSLDEFIVHDPWYGWPYFGPDVHFNQDTLVYTLWGPWSYYWAMITSPWRFSPAVPEQVDPGETFDVEVDVHYPGPGPFAYQFPTSNTTATITLPPGFSLAGGSATVPLPSFSSGETNQISWTVVAGETAGTHTIGLRASGIISGSAYSYNSYSDSIGGHATVPIQVGSGGVGSWGVTERLTDAEGSSTTSPPNGRSVYVDPSDGVHIVWADTRNGSGDIYYRHRDDDTWGPEVRLTNDGWYADTPAIAGRSADDLHVVWTRARNDDHRLYYSHWNGVTWSAPVLIGDATQRSFSPTIAVDASGHVHVAWQRIGGNGMMVYYQTWDGVQWGAAEYIAGTAGAQCDQPCLAVDGQGTVYLLYEREVEWTGVTDITCRARDAGGWSTPTAVSSDSSYAHWPSAVVGVDDRLHVVWHDSRGFVGDVYYRSFDGSTWLPEERVVDYPWDSQFPCVAIDGHNTLHLAWQDFRDGEGEIYYRYFDGTWSPEERVTTEEHMSTLPGLGVDHSGLVSLIWTDKRDGRSEIYFRERTSPLANVAEPTPASPPEMLRAVWPAPARRDVTIEFQLPQAGPAELRLFDAEGRMVRSLHEGSLPAGIHRILFDGRAVSNGILYCRLRAAGRQERRPILVIR